MKFKALSLLFIIVVLHCDAQNINNVAAKKLLKKSMTAMGGDAWKKVNTLSFDGYGYANLIDQSERPEGPSIPVQVSRHILKNLSENTFAVRLKELNYDFGNEYTLLCNGQFNAIKTGDKVTPTLQGDLLNDELSLAPELVLTRALSSPDLRFVKDTVYQKAQHSILAFTYGRFPVRLFLNQETDLLTAVEVTRPYNEGFSAIWGDVRKTVIYSFWMVLDKGLHYPLQQDTYFNGWYLSSFLINKWQVNSSAATDSLKIPPAVIEQDKALAKNTETQLATQLDKATQLVPGIWMLPGYCRSTVIEQPDGIVVIESSYSSAFGEATIEKAKKLFPGKKIKALISTSDAWLHIGGLRAFAAIPGIKIYHPVRNRAILDKLLKSSYITSPDKLAGIVKLTYSLNGVTDTLALGTGDNRLVMYAYKTETGDRQMMVYFPHHKIVYASDLYQHKDQQGKYWNPQIAWEVYHSIKTRKITVDKFYAMHSGVLPFSDLENDFKGE